MNELELKLSALCGSSPKVIQCYAAFDNVTTNELVTICVSSSKEQKQFSAKISCHTNSFSDTGGSIPGQPCEFYHTIHLPSSWSNLHRFHVELVSTDTAVHIFNMLKNKHLEASQVCGSPWPEEENCFQTVLKIRALSFDDDCVIHILNGDHTVVIHLGRSWPRWIFVFFEKYVVIVVMTCTEQGLN